MMAECCQLLERQQGQHGQYPNRAVLSITSIIIVRQHGRNRSVALAAIDQHADNRSITRSPFDLRFNRCHTADEQAQFERVAMTRCRSC